MLITIDPYGIKEQFETKTIRINPGKLMGAGQYGFVIKEKQDSLEISVDGILILEVTSTNVFNLSVKRY